MLDLSGEVDELWDELQAAFARVLRSGQFVLGPEVEAFETEAAAYLGARHAVGLNSGTDALIIGLRALGVGPGDEVITPAFSFFATAEAVSMAGATPVFADVEAASLTLDPHDLEACLSPRSKAVLPVHLYGRPCDMAAIGAFAEAHGLALLEDCAQSFGARYGTQQTGTIGHAGAFSFYPSKNLGAYGDGGLLVTDDAALAQTARSLRNHGARARYLHDALGYNSRLDALQAAILRAKLPRIESWNARRRAAAARYRRLLAGLPNLCLPADAPGHVYHQYTVRLPADARDHVRAALGQAGIGSVVYYPLPLHKMPVYQLPVYQLPVYQLPVYRGARRVLPTSEAAAHEVLSLPIWPGIGAAQQEQVAAALSSALGSSPS